MINTRRTLRKNTETSDINIAPLIDLVFLLLIFFMVTTSFVRETGVDINRPSALTAETKKQGDILIGVTADGRIFMEKRQIDIRLIHVHVARYLAEHPDAAVIIVADRASRTGDLIRVMDQCRLAGAKKISIAASKASKEDNGV